MKFEKPTPEQKEKRPELQEVAERAAMIRALYSNPKLVYIAEKLLDKKYGKGEIAETMKTIADKKMSAEQKAEVAESKQTTVREFQDVFTPEDIEKLEKEIEEFEFETPGK